MAEEAAPAASSLAAVADGVGLSPEQGGDDLIGNECRGAPPAPGHAHDHQGGAEPKVLAGVHDRGGAPW
jgi:hypothetical protein